MYACDIHIISFWGFFLSKSESGIWGTWKACLWSTYVANLRGEYICICVVFFLFFSFFRTGHLQWYTREHGPRLGEIVFDRETVAVTVIADGIEAELTEHPV